jgi:predicted DCC family thiol-disulfide oxidoreductase YuxK
MSEKSEKITVYYDGACPSCVRDRQNYERWSGTAGKEVCWLDITGQDSHLKALGIDPKKALTELHVSDERGIIHSELDAYILLLKRVYLLRPLAWLIGLPLVRPKLSQIYRRMVNKRLNDTGRL